MSIRERKNVCRLFPSLLLFFRSPSWQSWHYSVHPFPRQTWALALWPFLSSRKTVLSQICSRMQCHTQSLPEPQIRFPLQLLSKSLFVLLRLHGIHLLFRNYWQKCRHNGNQICPCYRSFTGLSTQECNTDITEKLVTATISYKIIDENRYPRLVELSRMVEICLFLGWKELVLSANVKNEIFHTKLWWFLWLHYLARF